MLRIHFTPEDLVRVRIAGQPDAMWETVLSLFRIRCDKAAQVFGPWRQDVLARSAPGSLRLLTSLTPGGYYPDFLTPPEGVHGIDAGLEAIRSTSAHRVRAELELLDRRHQPPQQLRRIHHGDREAWDTLVHTLKSHYRTNVEPYWDMVRSHVSADRARRSRLLLEGGVEALLSSFRPMIRWRAPVLEVDFGLADQDLHLEGRGLLLIPSFFSWNHPDTLRDPALPPVLVYPVMHDSGPGPAGPDRSGARWERSEAIEALIGITRAQILELLGNGSTTGELAARIGVTAGAVSQHIGVLRKAGLVVSVRAGRSVLHTLTPVGRALLDSV